MALDWNPIATAVVNALALAGRTATLRIPSRNAGGRPHDPTPGTPTDIAITMVEASRSVTQRQQDVVEVGDRVFLIAPPAGQEIKPGHLIVDGASTFTVKDADPTNPGETNLLYTVLARR